MTRAMIQAVIHPVIHPAPNFAPARRAFSLAEMALSMVIIAVICGATLSVTTIITRSASASADSAPAGQTFAARDALDQITRELKTATAVSEQTATAITFTVPDRTGDGVPETIRYSCTASGQPLTRQYNGGLAATIIPSMQSFSLAYVNNTVTVPMPPTTVVSAEQLLCSYEVTPNASWGLTTSHWEGAYFNPSLATGALSWSITKVGVFVKRTTSSTTGSITLQIQAADGAKKPTGAALNSISVNVTTIPTTNTWVEQPLILTGLTPGSGMTLVVTSTAASANANIAGKTGISPSVTATSSVYTNNSGNAWTVNAGTAQMEFRVYGTVTTPN